MGFDGGSSSIAQVVGLQTALDGKSALAHTHAFADLTSKPTTLSGYGITDAFTQTQADARYSVLAHTHTFASLTSKPTTLAGYGITDSFTKTAADARYGLIGQANTWAGGQTMNTTSGPSVTAGLSGALTTTSANAILARHNTSGAAGTGFGSSIAFQGDSTTTPNRDQCSIVSTWTLATDAARKGQLAFFSYSAATPFECIRMSSTGVAASIGFFGAAAVIRQVVSGSIASGAAFLSMKTALVNLGLITDSTTA